MTNPLVLIPLGILMVVSLLAVMLRGGLRFTLRSTPRHDGDTLAGLRDGQVAEVDRVSETSRDLDRRRLMDLGILPGTPIEYERRGLTGGLTSYRVRGTSIALRDEQAHQIHIRNRQQRPS